MKKSTKFFGVVWTLSIIYLGFFFNQIAEFIFLIRNGQPLLVQHYATVGVALLFLISTVFLLFRFWAVQPFNRQIFFATVVPTIALCLTFVFLFWLSLVEPKNQPLLQVRTTLRLSSPVSTSSAYLYIWLGTSLLLYFAYLFLVYFVMTRPLRKSAVYLEKLADGKAKDNISLGGGTQFQKIQQSMQKISSRYQSTENMTISEKPTFFTASQNPDAASCRYVGVLPIGGKKNSLALFENLEVRKQKEKEKLLQSKAVFEQAVYQFEKGQKKAAREGFQKALSLCKTDAIAKDYLSRC